MLTDNQYNMVYELLGRIYAQIQWQKIRTSKNAWDIYNHRVRSASCRGNIYQFVSRLCNYFGLQQTSFDNLKIIGKIREFENQALNAIYHEHIPVCMKGIEFAKKLKEEQKQLEKNKNQKKLFEE